MSYNFYRILHLFSVFGVMLSLGGMAIYVASGGTRASFTSRKFVSIIHGIGLFFIVVGGFGLLARLGLTQSLPGWILAKLCIWLILGGLPTLIYKKPQFARPIFILIWVLGGVAATLALTKPF